jgi:hypothetical protein
MNSASPRRSPVFFVGYWDGGEGRREHDHHWDRDRDRDFHDREDRGRRHHDHDHHSQVAEKAFSHPRTAGVGAYATRAINSIAVPA